MVVIHTWSILQGRGGSVAHHRGQLHCREMEAEVATGIIPLHCMIYSFIRSDNLWTLFCARVQPERWEKQGLHLRGGKHFIFAFSGRRQSISGKTRWFQSRVGATGISVSRCMHSGVMQRRGDWSGQASPKGPCEHRPEECKGITMWRSEGRTFQAERCAAAKNHVRAGIGRFRKEPVGCHASGVESGVRAWK